jgi:hypothetical protein
MLNLPRPLSATATCAVATFAMRRATWAYEFITDYVTLSADAR